tara:strand:+ start:924 stop:1286 length:363 start_codon:yes stop_codon:yes gene_type:complete
MANNIPQENTTQRNVKEFFDVYYSAPLEFPSNEVDAVIGFFEKRGFEKLSADTMASTLLRQAKIDNVKVFELLDTLKGMENVQLSAIVTEILNFNRQKISSLGYKLTPTDTKLESRNILV